MLSSIALPPTGGDTIFTASNDGEVARTTNATNWTDITGNLPRPDQASNPAGKPFFTQVTFNPANPSQAWVTIGRVGVGQLWYTSNAGARTGTHWVNLSGAGSTALPLAPALSVVKMPGHPGTIDVGTYYRSVDVQHLRRAEPRSQLAATRRHRPRTEEQVYAKVAVDWLSNHLGTTRRSWPGLTGAGSGRLASALDPDLVMPDAAPPGDGRRTHRQPQIASGPRHLPAR